MTGPGALPPVQVRGLASVIRRAVPACTARPELFFSPDVFEEEPPAVHAARADAAREVCAACPVRLACLAYALKTRPGSGVWAGYDADAGELADLAAVVTRPPGTYRPAAPGEVAA
jgi:hypothetical protein